MLVSKTAPMNGPSRIHKDTTREAVCQGKINHRPLYNRLFYSSLIFKNIIVVKLCFFSFKLTPFLCFLAVLAVFQNAAAHFTE